MKQVAGTLRLDLAQYREMAAFAQFGSDLDASTQRMLSRGQRLVEVLKQGQYVPLPVEQQIVILFAATNGYIDAVDVKDIRRYEEGLASFMERSHTSLYALIREKKELNDDVKSKLNAALTEFQGTFGV
jgi:F-type H+-transporting ATPase subunit alpha